MAVAAQVETLRTDLAAAQAHVRIGHLLGRALTLKETAMNQNYGQALDLWSTFFDEVGNEATAATDADLREILLSSLRNETRSRPPWRRAIPPS